MSSKISTNTAEKKSPLKMGQPGPEGSRHRGTYGTGMTKALEFVRTTLEKDGDVIKAGKTPDGGWEVEVEVIEPSEHMKKIGIPKPVYDKHVYRVILDKNFNVTSYERTSQKSSSPQA